MGRGSSGATATVGFLPRSDGAKAGGELILALWLPFLHVDLNVKGISIVRLQDKDGLPGCPQVRCPELDRIVNNGPILRRQELTPPEVRPAKEVSPVDIEPPRVIRFHRVQPRSIAWGPHLLAWVHGYVALQPCICLFRANRGVPLGRLFRTTSHRRGGFSRFLRGDHAKPWRGGSIAIARIGGPARYLFFLSAARARGLRR